ncbi:MAG: HAD family hydrolase [Euryarchaeota archaeon TMED85]|nr:MAG: HAD family hydrolase [Euryarchaeota archaeon TMED85]
MTVNFIKDASTIFWDFDGVIKDSVSVKSDAFEELFIPFGEEVAKKVKKHHEENGGMSRYEKFPIYLSWAGEKKSENLNLKYDQKFSKLVKQSVIESPWVNGVLEYLETNYERQQFFLVTATPQNEIEDILMKLKIYHFFKHIVGSPMSKKIGVKSLIKDYAIKIDHAIMIGDSMSDYQAAIENDVNFILRKTELNKKMQKQLKCKMIEHFAYG